MQDIFYIAILLCVPVALYLGVKADRKNKDKYESEALEYLDNIISKSMQDEDKVKYFRDSGGIWISTSRQDAEIYIKDSCKTLHRHGYIYHKGNFCISFDPQKNGVLIVLGRCEYEFNKNIYYSEWAEGNREFNDRVKKETQS